MTIEKYYWFVPFSSDLFFWGVLVPSFANSGSVSPPSGLSSDVCAGSLSYDSLSSPSLSESSTSLSFASEFFRYFFLLPEDARFCERFCRSRANASLALFFNSFSFVSSFFLDVRVRLGGSNPWLLCVAIRFDIATKASADCVSPSEGSAFWYSHKSNCIQFWILMNNRKGIFQFSALDVTFFGCSRMVTTPRVMPVTGCSKSALINNADGAKNSKAYEMSPLSFGFSYGMEMD